MRKIIDEAMARRLSVKAECDPRTLRKVLRGERVRGMPGHRARRVLIDEGLLDECSPNSAAA